MTAIKQEAKKMISEGTPIIPLFKNAKNNGDADFLTRDYTAEDADKYPDGNLGTNLKKTTNLKKKGWYCADLDSKWSIIFGNKWLPQNTKINGRISPNGIKEPTHYIFESDGNVPENIKDRETADLLVDHNLVVWGKTFNKKAKVIYNRYKVNNLKPAPFNESIKAIFNEVCFAGALAPHVKFFNKGHVALIIDSCFKLYCRDWSDDKRLKILLDFYGEVMPDSKDVNVKEILRKIKSNNNSATKNGGYKALSNSLGVEPLEVKKWFSWIGNVPEDSKYEKQKTFRNFMSTGVDMKSLMTEEIPPLQYAVSPILPEGLVLWAGMPKSMKSWTALLLLYCVQNGLPFLGLQTTQGDCLGLNLEDGKRRLKERTYKLGLQHSKLHPTIDLEAPYIGFGLEESLQQWIDSVKNPRLIVIDTLAHVKKLYGGKSNKTAYDVDTELLRGLQHLAMKNQITILFITHLTKAEMDYNFNRIQGSVGMQGMTDAMWLIDRGDNSDKASITGRGRDISDFQYAVTWNPVTWRYEYEGQLQEINMRENRLHIVKALRGLSKSGKDEFTPLDVIKYQCVSPQSKEARNIQKTMQRMRDAVELVDGNVWGTYKLPDASPPPFSNKKRGAGGIDFEADKMSDEYKISMS